MIRLDRYPHNHITQVDPVEPVEGCRACAEINPDRLTHPKVLYMFPPYVGEIRARVFESEDMQ